MGRADQVGDRWCILRTGGQRTLKLAASLNVAGIEAWTPAETQRRRKSRGSKAYIEREVAMMPTFVFVRASYLGDLVEALAQPINPHPAFSIFRFHGRTPLISNASMESLRAAEERGRRAELKKKRIPFQVGTTVQTPEGGFAGLSGIVEDCDGKFALVCFAGHFRVSIATFLLRTDEIQEQHRPDTGTTAPAVGERSGPPRAMVAAG